MIKKDSVLNWFLVAGICLGGAYWVSLPRNDIQEGQTAVIHLSSDRIKKIQFTAKDLKQEITTLPKDRWWISVERQKAVEASSPTSPTTGQDAFLASGRLKEVLKSFAPFQAVRVIGKITDKQKTEYGLDSSTKSLVIFGKDDGKLLSLLIGKSLFGSRHVYVQREDDQQVYLVAGDWLSDFEQPEARFFERTIGKVAAEEAQDATVNQSEKSQKFLHSKREANGNLIWTSDGGKESQNTSAGIWFGKLEQVKALQYLTETEQEALKSVQPVFEIKVNGIGSATDHFQMFKTLNQGRTDYVIYSEFLGRFVKIATPLGESLERDLGKLLGSE